MPYSSTKGRFLEKCPKSDKVRKKNVPVLRHIPEDEAADKLLELIEEDQTLRDRQPRTL